MTDEPQRRRPSGGGRHAAPGRSRAPRPTIPARSALRRAFPTSTAGRVAQGVLVVALAGALGGMAAQTSASADPRSGERLAARAAVTDAAVDALTVAQAARLTAQDVTAEVDQVDELEAATAELQDLLAEAGVAEVDDLAAGAVTTDAATGSAPATASPSAEPTAGATSAAEGLLSASGDHAIGVDDTQVSSEPSNDATSEPSSDAEPTADTPADATDSNADAKADSAGTAVTGTTVTGTAPVTTADGISPDDVVVPPVTDVEDATTTRLRAALQRVVQLSDEVLDTTQELADREAAAQAAEEAREAAEKAAAEKAEREAAEKAAQEAAERAAWKESLAGYANGQIPSSALCAASFDSNVLLRCDATEDLEALDKGFHAEFGEHMAISDSYRSYAGQVSCRARKGSLCAVPGTSNHGTGTAIDLGGGAQSFGTAEWTWLKENSEAHGWEHPDWAAADGSKPEPWHWEYTR